MLGCKRPGRAGACRVRASPDFLAGQSSFLTRRDGGRHAAGHVQRARAAAIPDASAAAQARPVVLHHAHRRVRRGRIARRGPPHLVALLAPAVAASASEHVAAARPSSVDGAAEHALARVRARVSRGRGLRHPRAEAHPLRLAHGLDARLSLAAHGRRQVCGLGVCEERRALDRARGAVRAYLVLHRDAPRAADAES